MNIQQQQHWDYMAIFSVPTPVTESEENTNSASRRRVAEVVDAVASFVTGGSIGEKSTDIWRNAFYSKPQSPVRFPDNSTNVAFNPVSFYQSPFPEFDIARYPWNARNVTPARYTNLNLPPAIDDNNTDSRSRNSEAAKTPENQNQNNQQLSAENFAPLSASSPMEYPHHTDSTDNGQTAVVMSVAVSGGGGHHDGIMHSQHVEVIKTAGHVPPLHSQADMRNMDNNNKEDLQEMSKMRIPVYDGYNGGTRATTLMYGSSNHVTTGNFDSQNYSIMAGQHPILQNYPNIGQDYYGGVPADVYGTYPLRLRSLQPQSMYQSTVETTEELLERLNRQQQQQHSLFSKQMTIEMPSPVDSGLGPEIMVTPKHENHDQSFAYDMHGAIVVQSMNQRAQKEFPSPRCPSTDRIVTSRDSPVNIPKLSNVLGFQYTFEGPNSTSVRKEDDRMTYINKGQFYPVTLDYVQDPNKPLKTSHVKSLLVLCFRDEKPHDEEVKCWAFWHARQHSMKQRILDVDAKNSTGFIGHVEEIANNAISFYWNPMEQPAKINVAVQCLSTDFSNQKGVKGLPLHIQIDTYDEAQNAKVPFHRGYCQVKVFCDKGANRKMLHEQRRDEKRRTQGRKKSDCEYQEQYDRSEFYHMSNLLKPPVLYIPPEDYERPPFPSLEAMYGMDQLHPVHSSTHIKGDEENGVDSSLSPRIKRARTTSSERVLIYAKKDGDEVYTALHLEPPTVDSLIKSICKKHNVVRSRCTGEVYKQCRKGILVKIDDEMIKHYVNEDSFELIFNTLDNGQYNITMIELDVANCSDCSSPT